MAAKKPPTIPLPEAWTKHVRTAMLHVISLAQYATAYTRSWAADSTNARLRIKAEYDCPNPATFDASPVRAALPAPGGNFPRTQSPRLLPRLRMPNTALHQKFAHMLASLSWCQAATMPVVARRVSVARLEGARLARHYPTKLLKVSGPLHPVTFTIRYPFVFQGVSCMGHRTFLLLCIFVLLAVSRIEADEAQPAEELDVRRPEPLAPR